MQKGKKNEDIIFEWLKQSKDFVQLYDFREYRLAQRIDVDCGIESIDGDIMLFEIKSDKHISENGNLFFETQRINHNAKDKWAYLGWGWRSPAQKLIVRNDNTNEAFIFDFSDLREWVGSSISKHGGLSKVCTDPIKTTIGILIPMEKLKPIYKQVIIPS